MTTTTNFGWTLVESNQANKHITVNEALVAIDAELQGFVVGGDPALGGDLSGTASAATVTHLQGIPVSTTDPTTGQILEYNGTAWAPAAHPYDLSLTVTGDVDNSEVLLRFVAPRAVNFPANFSTSYATAAVAATASTVFTLAKNGASIGTVTFAAAGTSGTWASSGGAAQALAAGDVLTLTGPATADTTLADIGFTIAGTR
jgi:hypothetical protein